MERKIIAVLFGGCSSEYEVSLQSAYNVLKSFPGDKYEPVMLGITKTGDWYYFSGDIKKIPEDSWHNENDCCPAAVSPNRSERSIILFRKEGCEKIRIDAAFPVLHGKNGEDGTVQGVFELAGIPVVGCGLIASALCMDKYTAHMLADTVGVRTPRSVLLRRNFAEQALYSEVSEIGYPVFVKPVKAGSSFGVTKVLKESELIAAVENAFEYDDTVLVEENISGFEVSCAVMGNDALETGSLCEIELSDGFFNFTEKYTHKSTKVHIPARVDRETSEKIVGDAKKLYKVLSCKGFARVDLFVSESGEIVFNEVNTIPGFTANSLFPGMFIHKGFVYSEIIERIIELALEE